MEQNEKHIIDQLNKRDSTFPGADYFEQLKKNILLETEIEKDVKVKSIFSRWYTYVAAAASITLLFTLVFRERNEPTVNKVQLDLSAVSKTEMMDYVNEHIEDFDIESLVLNNDSLPNMKSLESENVASTWSTQELEKGKEVSPFKQLNKNDILDYLEENAIDLDEEIIYGT